MTKLSSLKSELSAFTADESGATVIEYALLGALIIVVSVVIITSLGSKVNQRFTEIDAALN
jgi:pilus assembly protein Flp/PilA